MGYFVIGDIHGNYKALQQCLYRSGYTEDDYLIGLGDYTDGHPDSVLVVDLLHKLPNFIGVKGNHDVWAEEWLTFGIAKPEWVHQGGYATIQSYKKTETPLDAHRTFFRNLVPYWIEVINGKTYGFVHAGWTSKKGLGHDQPYAYQWDRTLWRNSPLYRQERMGELDLAFIGHSAVREPPLVRKGNLINLDQGAGGRGKLTICNVETLEWWQSDDAITLYGKP